MHWGTYWFNLLVQAGKKEVTHHLLLLMAAVRLHALNWRHYALTQKANAVAKVQAYLAYHSQGHSVVEACQKCSINHINFIKWKNGGAVVKKQLKEKRGQKSSSMAALFCPFLAQSQVSCNDFFEYHEQVIPLKLANYPRILNPSLQSPK